MRGGIATTLNEIAASSRAGTVIDEWQIPVPEAVKGACEILGALGLILPGLLRIKTYLTVLAAIGLTIIMIGAFVVVAMGDGIGAAIGNLVIALLCAFVAYGRAKLSPLKS